MSDRRKAALVGVALFAVWAVAPDSAAGAAETAVAGTSPLGWLTVLVVIGIALWAVWSGLRASALRAQRREHARRVQERAEGMRPTYGHGPNGAELSLPLNELQRADDLDAYIEGILGPWQDECRRAGLRVFESRQEGDRFVWRAYR